MTALWHAAKPYRDEPPEDPYVRYRRLRHVDNILRGFYRAPRSMQMEIGSSEIGWECDRRLSYRLHGVATSNVTDPVRAITGTGWHLWLAETHQRCPDPFRYLIEYECAYRGVIGHGDLFDRREKVLTDWKTSKKDRIRKMRAANQVPAHYRVQVNHNAVALRVNRYEEPVAVELMFIAVDGNLDNDSWLWTATVDPSVVDTAIDRVDRLRLVPPEQAEIYPGRDCAYCSWYDPQSDDPSKSCNAGKGRKR